MLQGIQFKTTATIASNTFRPESTAIPFTIFAPDIIGNLSLPRWNAHAPHTQKESTEIFKSKGVTISGSYRYFAEVRAEHVEQLHLDIEVRVIKHSTGFISQLYAAA